MKKKLILMSLLCTNLCFSADFSSNSYFTNIASNISIDKKETLNDPNMRLKLNDNNKISETINNRVNDIIENIKIGVGGEVQFLDNHTTYTSGLGTQYSLDKNNKILTSFSYKYYDYENRLTRNGFERETRLEYNINNRYSVYTRYSFNQLDDTAKNGQFAAGFNFFIKN